MARSPRVERVDRARFPAALATLREVVQRASFVAFDTELSGLSAPLEQPSLMDSVEQRYKQMRESAQSFAIVQVGVSCFTWRADARVFDVRTFQFPLFPLSHGGDHLSGSELPDRSFLVQAKCLSYIRDHGFDLNAWVDDGIGYLSHDEQSRLEHVLQRPVREDVAAKFRGDPSTVVRTADNDRFLKDMRRRLEVLTGLKVTPRNGNGGLGGDEVPPGCELEADAVAQFLRETVKVVRPSVLRDGAGVSRRTFVTEPLAPFRRSAVIALVSKEFPKVEALDCPTDNDNDADVKAAPWKRRLRLVAVEKEETKTKLQEAHAAMIEEEHELRNLGLVGFTAVFDVLMGAGKRTPLIGHNMLLDVMQCYEKFHGPLPDSCARFLFELKNWLGDVAVFDTKVLVEYAMDHIDVFGERLEHSALEYVHDTITKDPFHGPPTRDATPHAPDGIDSTPLSAHQAGYDAYMTGMVFLRVCSGLGVPNEAIAAIGSLDSDYHDQPRWRETMLQLRNHLKMIQLLPAVGLTLPGPFPGAIIMPSRKTFLRVHLARVWLPKLKKHHIQHCIAWALDIRSTKLVKVRYENKSSVFIELPTAEQVEKLLSIREECKEVTGSDRDPLPSLGCVDLVRIEVKSEEPGATASGPEPREPMLKRQRVEESSGGGEGR